MALAQKQANSKDPTIRNMDSSRTRNLERNRPSNTKLRRQLAPVAKKWPLYWGGAAGLL